MSGTAIVDTNAYTAFKKGRSEAIEIMRSSSLIAMNTIIIGELLGGFACGNKENFNKQELQQFLNSNRVKVFPITENTSNYYAEIYSLLRKKERQIPTNDILLREKM